MTDPVLERAAEQIRATPPSFAEKSAHYGASAVTLVHGDNRVMAITALIAL